MPNVDAVAVFRAIADPTRRAVLDMLARSERTASEIAEPFDMSMAAVSQHLKVLLDADLVRVEPQGRERRYRINRKPLHAVDRWLHRIVDPAGHVWNIRKEG